MTATAHELPGLEVHLDQLVHYAGPNLPDESPHAFIYFITIRNKSDRAVTLLARKWVVESEDGGKMVIEGDRIVGEMPHLQPGESFSYNSYHVASRDSAASGSFHGRDIFDNLLFVRIPPFKMKIPDQA